MASSDPNFNTEADRLQAELAAVRFDYEIMVLQKRYVRKHIRAATAELKHATDSPHTSENCIRAATMNLEKAMVRATGCPPAHEDEFTDSTVSDPFDPDENNAGEVQAQALLVAERAGTARC